ncbi:YihY/virulence factor BrkB family protein [Sphingobacterium spiritivorum]|uniref:YihY family protein n=1 Tax=Sphingobacterium spiritivorum ATCC 33300 TaxID=525372 RepID=C2G5M5_SPHSI|nr:YihY/virulence factor BrkB family protein [Sphingobacterium spiritivorum]EEI89514.1 YihY family protein [Sphingobacterium spiritivorum ATCC 33300]QQS94533.1 YihY/virulence factor BrkB family protein [Sphingobacterium spiritivorum]
MSKIPFKARVKDFGGLMMNVINGFLDDKCMKMSASLAYYTVFSIGPLIIIIIWCIGFFYGTQLDGPTGARDEVFKEFSELFGKDVAVQVQSTIQKISFENRSNIGIIVGIVTLIITSTTIFVDIQDSINTIWKVKAKAKKGWLKLIINRLISFSMVLGLGFLLIASLMINGIIVALTNYFGQYFENISLPMLDWINTGITFMVITALFGFIFSFLPDAKVRFRDILGGAIFTALLFMFGRYAISLYITQSATASAYGAAGSIIVLLGWVYYSSAILYFGAEFTKEIAIRYGKGIRPTSFAVLVKQTELEIDVETGQRKISKSTPEVPMNVSEIEKD